MCCNDDFLSMEPILVRIDAVVQKLLCQTGTYSYSVYTYLHNESAHPISRTKTPILEFLRNNLNILTLMIADILFPLLGMLSSSYIVVTKYH